MLANSTVSEVVVSSWDLLLASLTLKKSPNGNQLTALTTERTLETGKKGLEGALESLFCSGSRVKSSPPVQVVMRSNLF